MEQYKLLLLRQDPLVRIMLLWHPMLLLLHAVLHAVLLLYVVLLLSVRIMLLWHRILKIQQRERRQDQR